MYQIVVLDESAPTKTVAIDKLGVYNPKAEPTIIQFDKEKTLAWLKKGATPTEKVRYLLGKVGILPPVSYEGKTKRQPKVKTEGTSSGTEATAAAPAAAPQVQAWKN